MRALIVLNEHKQSASGVVSLQVLQEYFVTVTRKYGIGAADARRKVELFAAFDVVEPVLGDVLAASKCSPKTCNTARSSMVSGS
jgi:predicted nucleic acid-binding protein